MWMNNSSSTLLRDDAISVNINGEKKHFVCIRAYRDNEGARLYDLFDENGQITSIDDRTFKVYLSLGAAIIKPSY